MSKKFSSSNVSSRSHSLVGNLWASVAVVAAALPVVCNALGHQASNAASMMHCGPIDDTIEYLLWLIQQLGG